MPRPRRESSVHSHCPGAPRNVWADIRVGSDALWTIHRDLIHTTSPLIEDILLSDQHGSKGILCGCKDKSLIRLILGIEKPSLHSGRRLAGSLETSQAEHH